MERFELFQFLVLTDPLEKGVPLCSVQFDEKGTVPVSVPGKIGSGDSGCQGTFDHDKGQKSVISGCRLH